MHDGHQPLRGGSAEGGRLKEFQAILPLRGKIINAYKAREDKVLANEEVQSIVRAVGTNTLRIAKNRDQFLRPASDALSHRIEVVSPMPEPAGRVVK